LAREACEIEIDILGRPIGKQDQYIVAYGGLRFIHFKPDGTITVEKVRLSEGGSAPPLQRASDAVLYGDHALGEL
jgi:galactokinase/mevalonate kinase-like predicted kinase